MLGKNPQSGIALLLVLWILVILMTIVFSFAVMTRGGNYGLLAFKEGLGKKYLAQAGINRGILEVVYRAVNKNQTNTFTGMEVWKFDGTSYEIPMSQEEGCLVRVTDETGKIPLNSMTDSSGIVLKNLLIHQGVPPENADIIVDSVLDWKDKDNLHRLHGAENDYYMSLPNPYMPGNTAFETLEELILVRGITMEILYGNRSKKGIINFLSIHNTSNQINVNVAPKEVLASLPGMDADAVEQLMAFRKDSEIKAVEDLKGMIGDRYLVMAPYITLTSETGSPVYCIEATGYKNNPQKGYSVMAKVAFDGGHHYHYVYYKSSVEIHP